MKDDRGIKLLIEDIDEDLTPPFDAADQTIEDHDIDEILRLCANASTAQIDFESIKQRAIASAASSIRLKRGRIRKLVRYALLGCGALILGFALRSVIDDHNSSGDSNIIAINPPASYSSEIRNPHSANETEDFVSHKGTNSDKSPQWLGTVSDDSCKDIAHKVSDLFMDSRPRPDSMLEIVNDADAHISAIGTDQNGSEVCYDFVMCTDVPISLAPGEAYSDVDGEFLVYYWRVSDDSCVSVRFAGFEQQQAESMFNSIFERIVQIVPNDGRK